MPSDLKILFVSFIGDLKHTTKGFVKKDLDKVQALNNINGVSCSGVSFAEDIESDYFYKENYFVKKIPAIRKRKFFESFYQTKNEIKQLDNFLKDRDYDAILFRYNIASRSLHKLVKKHHNKIIFEHNTFEYIEHSLQINQRRELLKFSLKPGYFLYYFEGKLWPLFCEKYYGPKIRLNAKAGISVTGEIADFEMNYAPGYKNVVITNGVEYKMEMIHTPTLYEKQDLKLFMLLGTGANWHGVDRVIHGLKKYSGSRNITVDIIGYYYQGDVELGKELGLEDKIRFLPPYSGEELNKQLNNYHISFGTLALHRKELKQAAPLKVRETLMRGFPNIIAYNDPDFENVSDINNSILVLPANESAIDFEEIVKFADRVLTINNYPQLISEWAKPKISYESKANQTVEFIKSFNVVK